MSAMKSLSFPLAIILIILVGSSFQASASSDRPVQPIGDLKSPHVLRLANFAVNEHNKLLPQGGKLEFLSVVKGTFGVFAGSATYDLNIYVKDNGSQIKYPVLYFVEVVEKLGVDFLNVFRKL